MTIFLNCIKEQNRTVLKVVLAGVGGSSAEHQSWQVDVKLLGHMLGQLTINISTVVQFVQSQTAVSWSVHRNMHWSLRLKKIYARLWQLRCGKKSSHVLLVFQDVAVNVVGKYQYQMMSPAENSRVPVIVDIILVGRTKIITLHSSIWVENFSDRNVSFRLHVPMTPLAAPPGNPSGRDASLGNDKTIGPLEPRTGACSDLL